MLSQVHHIVRPPHMLNLHVHPHHGHATTTRLRVSSIGDMREVAPRVTELQNILQLVCTMFQVPSALISIFGDRSIHIITSTGAFQVRVGRCGAAWRGVVWCGVVWCGVVWCGVVWCGVVWCGVVWCAATPLRLHAVHRHTHLVAPPPSMSSTHACLHTNTTHQNTTNTQEGDFPWRFSMCAWTMASERHCMMIVNDALADARFCNNAAVRTFGVRFYAGAPLVSSAGHRVGTLCFADTSPRAFDEHSMRLLCNLSELVTRALEREVALVQAQAVAQAPPGAQAAAAAQQLQAQQRYDVLLRSADCLNRCGFVGRLPHVRGCLDWRPRLLGLACWALCCLVARSDARAAACVHAVCPRLAQPCAAGGHGLRRLAGAAREPGHARLCSAPPAEGRHARVGGLHRSSSDSSSQRRRHHSSSASGSARPPQQPGWRRRGHTVWRPAAACDRRAAAGRRGWRAGAQAADAAAAGLPGVFRAAGSQAAWLLRQVHAALPLRGRGRH
jgi:GAF domain-containing protein